MLNLGNDLVGIAAKNGKFLWNYNKVANGTANIPTCIVKDDLVFCTTGYGAGAALLQLVPPSAGGIQATERYFLRGNVLQNHHGGVVLVGDYIYGGHGHENGLPFCLNMKSGEFAWKPVRGAGDGSGGAVPLTSTLATNPSPQKTVGSPAKVRSAAPGVVGKSGERV